MSGKDINFPRYIYIFFLIQLLHSTVVTTNLKLVVGVLWKLLGNVQIFYFRLNLLATCYSTARDDCRNLKIRMFLN